MIRNTTNILKPTKGWGQIPSSNDTRTADDVERVRNYRNKISHATSSEMKTKDFNESALDLISVSSIIVCIYFYNKMKNQ